MEEAEDLLTRTTVSKWRTVSDPKHAGQLFCHELLQSSKDLKSLLLYVDIRKDKQEQDKDFVTFYKRDNIQWASPLQCKLQGDVATGSGVSRHMMSTVIYKLISGFHINLGNAAITKLFEGECDHQIPSVSRELLDRDMFTIAGRMIGHSFLHHGPSFPGLSTAIMHTLFEGLLETTPVTIRDCPDLDIRDAVEMLEGDAELKESDSVHQLCRSWNLPAPNATNRKQLSQKILFHAVIEQTRPQIIQFRKGLKETGLWLLLIHRRDAIPILFPRESEAELTPQMILDCIIWPSSVTVVFDSFREDDVDESDIMDVHRVTLYLKTFIENGCFLNTRWCCINASQIKESNLSIITERQSSTH
ncbi:unnamed protein product [Pleuronectes platessa]|uniref:Uncharacterized protein n=1 Tax=Pleuronectes platessa TaxID=8262 RepID=A0A9N7U3Z3_PLEPL|nr:unnamed protein product [Pleuronectes platessa]